MHATKDPSRGSFYLLERLHGLAVVVERGGVVLVERLRIPRPQHERELIILSENALRHGYRFAQQRLGFFEAL